MILKRFFSFRQIVIAFALMLAGDLRGGSIDIESVIGDNSSLTAVFNVTWDAADIAGPPVQILNVSTNGTWAGGNFQFSFFAGEDGFVTPGGLLEGFAEPLLRTTWNDGWVPPAIFEAHYFLFVDGNTFSLTYPGLTNVPVTSNGLTYLFSADYSGTMNTATDTSGSAHIAFNLSRVAPVPEPSIGSLLLVGSLIALKIRRRRPC